MTVSFRHQCYATNQFLLYVQKEYVMVKNLTYFTSESRQNMFLYVILKEVMIFVYNTDMHYKHYRLHFNQLIELIIKKKIKGKGF